MIQTFYHDQLIKALNFIISARYILAQKRYSISATQLTFIWIFKKIFPLCKLKNIQFDIPIRKWKEI